MFTFLATLVVSRQNQVMYRTKGGGVLTVYMTGDRLTFFGGLKTLHPQYFFGSRDVKYSFGFIHLRAMRTCVSACSTRN